MQNQITKKISKAACTFLLATALLSCEKDAAKKTKVTVPSTSTTTTTTTTTPSTGTATPSTIVNWDNKADGVYSITQALVDFKAVPFWGGDSYRSQISGGKLKTTLVKNLLAGEGGVISRIDAQDGTEYQLQFDFSWGGKVGFGLLMGEGNTGGDPAWDGNGGSLRLMWYKNTSTSPVILKPYVYYKDQPGTYGNDFGKTYPSTGSSIQKGIWYNVKMYVKSNTGSNADGRVQLVINGTTLLDQSIRWTTNDLQRMVKNVCFETFRGGAETYWQSATDGSIYFDNVSWTAIQP